MFSSIDEGGRYAYRNQPWIAQWNLARFAETLIPLIDDDADRAVERATTVIQAYPAQYEAEWLAVMRGKLGLAGEEEGDRELAEAFLEAMAAGRADFTLAFRGLSEAVEEDAPGLLERFDSGEALREWLPRWRARLAREDADPTTIAARLRGTNPLYIPRNHQVEAALAAAAEGDLAPFETLAEVLATPFEAQPGREAYARPAPAGEAVFRTFCGT